MIDGGAADVVAALEMHLENAVPVRILHFVEHGVAKNAGGADHRVQAFERVERLLDHALDAVPVCHAVGIRNCLAPRGPDLPRYPLPGARPAFISAPYA